MDCLSPHTHSTTGACLRVCVCVRVHARVCLCVTADGLKVFKMFKMLKFKEFQNDLGGIFRIVFILRNIPRLEL